MSKSKPQSFKSHGRFDPLYHLVLFLFLVANLVFAVFHLVHHRDISAAWLLVLSLVVFIPVLRLRQYPLKMQDRLIRLEERLRLQALAPADFQAQIPLLSEDQLIGLRFAGNDEVAALAEEALEVDLTRKQIKERIRNWRADNWRV